MPAKTSQPINPWSAIDAIMAQEPEPTGPDWFTSESFAKRYGLSLGRACNKLKEMHLAGMLDRWKGRSASAAGYHICKYRVKPTTKSK